MGAIKKIIAAPFKITWAITKGVGKVAFSIVDEAFTAFVGAEGRCIEQYHEYDSASNEELVDVIKHSKSGVEKAAAATQLKNRG